MRSPSARPDWRELLLLAAFIAVGVGRIVATYRQLSATFDEPVHLESGIEWLQYGRLTYNQMHPPLSRAFIAAGPYLDGVRWQGKPDWQTEGIAELHARRDYWRTLALARAGVLPFFVLAVVGTWWLARRIFGREVALISAGALTMVPPVLGHAGLATTDLPVAALMPVVIAAGITWLERPTRGATLALGAACGIAVLLKFSALVFVPASLIAMVLLKAALEPRRASRPPVPGYSYGGPMLGVLLTAFLVLWAGYRFHVGSLDSIQLGGLRLGAFVPPAVARAPVVPAPEFWTGLLIVLWYNRLSIPAYVLGEVVPGGTWYFFPLALGVKTPLAFLVLMVIGLVVTAYVAWRRRLWMTAIPLATALARPRRRDDQPDRARSPAPARDLPDAGDHGGRGRRSRSGISGPAGGWDAWRSAGWRRACSPPGSSPRRSRRIRTTCPTSTSWRRRARSTSCSTATWTTARTSGGWLTRCAPEGSTRSRCTSSPSATTCC